MEKSIELYQAAAALCKNIKTDGFSWKSEAESFKKLLNEFFTNPTQKCGFSSAVTFKKVNEAFENYIKRFANSRDLFYSDFVLQCRIDCFFATLIELYDLNTVEEILGYSKRISMSDEVEDLMDETWDKVEAIAREVAEYLARENVDLDGMTKITTGVNQIEMSKFIDHPGITERKGLWIRVWITHDVESLKNLKVRIIIMPQEENGVAAVYEITPICTEWFDTLTQITE